MSSKFLFSLRTFLEKTRSDVSAFEKELVARRNSNDVKGKESAFLDEVTSYLSTIDKATTEMNNGLKRHKRDAMATPKRTPMKKGNAASPTKAKSASSSKAICTTRITTMNATKSKNGSSHNASLGQEEKGEKDEKRAVRSTRGRNQNKMGDSLAALGLHSNIHDIESVDCNRHDHETPHKSEKNNINNKESDDDVDYSNQIKLTASIPSTENAGSHSSLGTPATPELSSPLHVFSLSHKHTPSMSTPAMTLQSTCMVNNAYTPDNDNDNNNNNDDDDDRRSSRSSASHSPTDISMELMKGMSQYSQLHNPRALQTSHSMLQNHEQSIYNEHSTEDICKMDSSYDQFKNSLHNDEMITETEWNTIVPTYLKMQTTLMNANAAIEHLYNYVHSNRQTQAEKMDGYHRNDKENTLLLNSVITLSEEVMMSPQVIPRKVDVLVLVATKRVMLSNQGSLKQYTLFTAKERATKITPHFNRKKEQLLDAGNNKYTL